MTGQGHYQGIIYSATGGGRHITTVDATIQQVLNTLTSTCVRAICVLTTAALLSISEATVYGILGILSQALESVSVMGSWQCDRVYYRTVEWEQQYQDRPRNLHQTALATQTWPPTRIYMHFHLPPITFTGFSTWLSSFVSHLTYTYMKLLLFEEYLLLMFEELLLLLVGELLLWALLHKSGWSCLWKWGRRGAPVKTLDSLISSFQIPGDTRGDHHPERFAQSMRTFDLFEN